MTRGPARGAFRSMVLPWLTVLAIAASLPHDPLSAEDRLDEGAEPSPEQRISAEDRLDEGAEPSPEQRISLDLKGIDLIELFRILSLKTGLTIVPTKGVSGRITTFLNDLTFQDVLDIILVSQDLAQDRKGNILYIMTAAEYEQLYGKKYHEKRLFKSLKLTYAKPSAVFDAVSQIKSDIGKIVTDETSGVLLLIDVPEKLALMEQTIRELDRPPRTEIFDLKYAKAADIKTHLTEAITDGPGEVFVDERSNMVIVSDLPEKMRKLKRMLRAFDAEPRQVFIEAEIVQVTLSDQFQRGVDWEKVLRDHQESTNLVSKFPITPALSTFGKVTIGIAPRDTFRGFLQLLSTFGDTKILSRPRIAVINNQEAKILVGAREAYVTQTLSQAQASTVTSEDIQFIDVGVKLNVVPSINADGFVTIKIKPEVSSVRETITTSLGSRVPIVETSESETVVKVKDGTMIMIAGLMKEEQRDERRGVPKLSKIPLLGPLFETRTAKTVNTELIIFLTPRIMSGASQLAGTEPQRWIPPEITPQDLQQALGTRSAEAGPSDELPATPGDLDELMKGLKGY